MLDLALRALLQFAEPNFPVVDLEPAVPIAVERTRSCDSSADLARALEDPEQVLVWRHGSAYPEELAPAIVRFLERGGSLLYLGGAPFTRPVSGAPGARVVGPSSLALLKELRLNRVDPGDDVGGGVLSWPDSDYTHVEPPLPAGARARTFEPRFADTRDFPGEDGSPGTRDAAVSALLPWNTLPWRSFPGGYTPAPAALAVDRLRGRYAGGRWVFWMVDRPPSAGCVQRLVGAALTEPAELCLRPAYALVHGGEPADVRLTWYAPGAAARSECRVEITVEGPGGFRLVRTRVLGGAMHSEASLAIPGAAAPGLYTVAAVASRGPGRSPLFARTGFWVDDRDLFQSGAALSFEDGQLLRDCVPEPVVGTTLMSASVQRNFLFEPNPAEWDGAFAALAADGVNLVRTGVWSAYRKISLHPGTVDEAWLRALEAYYLTARKHGIAVLFTFFAFLPESFGGRNPYLDPRAIEGQRAYLSAVARRFEGAKEILWDLINEPSFSSAAELWKCRPNGDAFEEAAFRGWLERRFGPDFEAVARRRWRLLPGAPVGLPALGDFAERTVFEDSRPYRAQDYVHFAQDAFADWSRAMAGAIRGAGSTAPITVGQDEGGLQQRPSPLFHYSAVDFTSMHTWWNNDALLWDGVMAKASGVPLLVSETGIMQRERLDGAALRSPDAAALLLSRKCGYAFAAGAFGVVQWCYDVNPFMASDNEAAIGLRRVDGSFKPERDVLADVAAFFARNKARFARPRPPAIALLWPAAESFSARDFQTRGTRRAVRALFEELGVAAYAVSEYRAAEQLGSPRLIVLPACRGLSDAGFAAVRAAVERGSVLHASGYFEADDAGLPAERLGASRRALALAEEIEIAGAPALPVRFPLDVLQSSDAAVVAAPESHAAFGSGRILHRALPLEWAEEGPALRAAYAEALAAAGLAEPDVRAVERPHGLLLRAIEYAEATLVIAVNEAPRDVEVEVEALFGRDVPEPLRLAVRAGRARYFVFDRELRLADSSGL